jgi:Na+/H+-dicarboxylate symporter
MTRLTDSPRVVLGSILAGVVVGHLAPGLAGDLGVIGDIYIDLLKMVVLPFMVAALIFSLRKLLADQQGSTILPRILLAFAGTFCLAVLAGLLAGLLVGPGRALAPETLLAMGKLAGTGALGGNQDTLALFGSEVSVREQSLGSFALSLIPVNIFAALTQGETLKVMAFSLMFGLAVGRITGRVAETLTDVLETVYQACLTLTEWFNRLLPLVLFAVVASRTASTGLEPLRAMLKFLLALALGSGAVLGLSLWGLRLASRRSWTEVLASQREPLLMAMVTRSAHACMPKMIASLVETLGFSRNRIELLVPVGVSVVRAGAVLYLATATVFIAQLYDVHFGAAQLGVVAAGSMMAGLAASGMSSAVIAVSLLGLVCSQLRLPYEAALALFLAVDPVCDIAITVVEVACNNAFAATVAGLSAEREGAAAAGKVLETIDQVQP